MAAFRYSAASLGSANAANSDWRYELVFLVMRPPEFLGKSNVIRLRVLESPAKQMYFVAISPEIDAIARAEIHSQLRQPFPDREDVPKVSILDSVDTNPDPVSSRRIESIQPFTERLSVVVVSADQYLARNCFQFIDQPASSVTCRSHQV